MVKKLYEGMFLVDSADAAADWDGVLDTIRTILGRAGAELVSMRKWDERKLAYDIDGKSRGTYMLCYFHAEGARIAGIERDVQLNDRVMRALILNAEHMTQEDMDKATPAEIAERGEVKRAEEEEDVDVDRKEEDVDEDVGEEGEHEESEEEEDEEEEGEEKEGGGDDEAGEESEEEQQEGEAKKDEDVGEEKGPEGSEEDEEKN